MEHGCPVQILAPPEQLCDLRQVTSSLWALDSLHPMDFEDYVKFLDYAWTLKKAQ